jgi:predicted amidophosphoribosyltransferase
VRVLEGLAELLFPTRCAGCELPGSVLCASCRAHLPLIEPDGACPACGAPFGALVCTECWNREWAFEAAMSLGEFESELARAVVLHKDAGERRLGDVLGGLLGDRVAERWPGWAQGVAFVPATHAALTRRGFDHGRSIAEGLAGRLDVPLLDALERTDSRDQRALGRSERASNAAASFSPARGPVRVRDRVLLCDDVFTTGATLDTAAEALLASGAAFVRCATIARVW